MAAIEVASCHMSAQSKSTCAAAGSKSTGMPSATAAAMTERHGSSGRHRGRAKRCRSRDRKNPLTHRTFSIFFALQPPMVRKRRGADIVAVVLARHG
jgi:hypothetical protein